MRNSITILSPKDCGKPECLTDFYMESWSSLGLNCAQLLGDGILGRIRYYFVFYFWLLEYETRVPVVISLCFFGASLLVTKAPFHKKRDINNHHEDYFDYRRYHKPTYVGSHKFVGMDYFCVSQPAGLSVTERNARLLTDAYELAIPKILGLVHILDHHHELSQKVCIYAKRRKKRSFLSIGIYCT